MNEDIRAKGVSNERLAKKEFTRKEHLERHKLIHSGIKRYQCTICEKKITLKHELIKHNRIHFGKKPFGCDKCNKKVF